jgi:type IV pilus assembly protein PilC
MKNLVAEGGVLVSGPSRLRTRCTNAEGLRHLIFRRTKIADHERAEFATQLAVLLQARVSLHRSLEVLIEQATNPRVREVVQGLKDQIQRGGSLDRALADQPEVFDRLFVTAAEVGQESGRLPEVMGNLAEHIEKMHALKTKLSQALTYPLLVLAVAAFAVGFLLAFIVPSFAEVFRTLRAELPASTRFVLWLSGLLRNGWPYALGLLMVIVLGTRGAVSSSSIKSALGRYLPRVPLLGPLVMKNHVARFCRSLGTMLQAQVPLVDALGIVERLAASPEMREEIGRIAAHVKRGKTVAEPLHGSRFFPPMVMQMVSVGEETSELDEMLMRLANYYEAELESKLEMLSSVIEPVLILILGLLVAAILVSMYLPMFDLVGVVGGG